MWADGARAINTLQQCAGAQTTQMTAHAHSQQSTPPQTSQSIRRLNPTLETPAICSREVRLQTAAADREVGDNDRYQHWSTQHTNCSNPADVNAHCGNIRPYTS